MKASEKAVLARFLDTASDWLRDGYALHKEEYSFTDDDPPPSPPPLPLAYLVDESGGESLEAIAAEIAGCTSCGLGKTRTNAVPGEGPEHPLVMVIGEGPGADEDASGRPFVGKAGQLLDKMLAAIGLSRDRNCYIANVVKCRPPENRDPAPEEIAACASYLETQIRLLKPKAILCAGRVAAQFILSTGEGINRLRGRFGEYPAAVAIEKTGTLQSDGMIPVPVLPTYHPSAILRDESLKRPAFEDLKLLMVKLAAMDKAYAGECRPLLEKYAAQDPAFSEQVREYLD
ncbi:MAG: uracil-DNA glycosylase [Treponema sp.]|jgi:DNA polymerase|nr:uracil-DNA glycosylase [Treponema sp.]